MLTNKSERASERARERERCFLDNQEATEEYSNPHSPFGHVARLGRHKGAQTSIGPSQSPSRSWRRRAPWDVPPPWGKGFGIPNRSPDSLVRRAGRDPPFPVSAGSRERDRDVARGGTRVTCHHRQKNYGHRTPPCPCCPHSGPPVVPQYPLTPSGWHALRAGVWHRCRRVVAPVAPQCPLVPSGKRERGLGTIFVTM